jgi:triosephosphate isomerase (TIM)
MSRYLIANWKMHGGLVWNEQFFSSFGSEVMLGVEVGFCVPSPYFFQCRQLLMGSAIGWGAQDVSEHFEGAYTGEVSVNMLEDFGCRYVIVGHSERRQYHAESSGTVARKLDRVMQSLKKECVPIICVGEHLSDREEEGGVEKVLSEQLDPVLSVLKLHPDRRALIAYEPIWAIGTGVVAEPAEVQEVHAWLAEYIRARLGHSLPILYGGSVKAENAKNLINLPFVDGFLVGGASLNPQAFRSIMQCY